MSGYVVRQFGNDLSAREVQEYLVDRARLLDITVTEPSDSDTLRKLANRFDAVDGFWQLPVLWNGDVISIGAVRALHTLAQQLDVEHDGMIP